VLDGGEEKIIAEREIRRRGMSGKTLAGGKREGPFPL